MCYNFNVCDIDVINYFLAGFSLYCRRDGIGAEVPEFKLKTADGFISPQGFNILNTLNERNELKR